VSNRDQSVSASIGDETTFASSDSLTLTIRFLDPETNNHNGDNPSVARVDLIIGEIAGPAPDKTTDENPSTQVLARFEESDWDRDGPYREISFQLPTLTTDSYIRVRGTSTNELEPSTDPRGENPWQDLWFYSNPIRIRLN
jgi:hypothetical protein